MIFVTVGSCVGTYFDRLLTKMDEIAGIIDEEVIIQTADSNYRPVNAKYFRYLPHSEILPLIKEARVMVCHAGAGSIIDGLKCGTPIIAVPRLKGLDRIPDSHQLDMASSLANEGIITVIYNLDDLNKALINPIVNRKIYKERAKILIANLKNYINNLK